MISSVKDGIYAVSFGGGQVDITSGKFVFSCTEAYKVENGKVGAPVKGAMLIGNGPDALTRVEMIGNDMKLDPGMGTCGKQGQGVPVGVGQPSMRINAMTVGGFKVFRTLSGGEGGKGFFQIIPRKKGIETGKQATGLIYTVICHTS
jgi:TldD protein